MILPVMVELFSLVLQRFPVLFFPFITLFVFITGSFFVNMVPMVLYPMIIGAVTDAFAFNCFVVARMVRPPVIIRAVTDAFTLDYLVMTGMVEPAMMPGMPSVFTVTIRSDRAPFMAPDGTGQPFVPDNFPGAVVIG